MKIVYSNISPISKAYTNINHIFFLKDQNPQKVYLCVWDNFAYESPFFSHDNLEQKGQKLRENVKLIEKIMKYLEMDYKIIYLSEAWARLFRNSELSGIFQRSLSSISLEQLSKGLEIKYIPFGYISLSRVNYIIADYLIATYLPDLFPELCSSQPTHYVTSERFKVFQPSIDHTLKSGLTRYSPPKSIFVTKVPVIMHPEKKLIPALEMSQESIADIASAYYKEKPNEKEIYDFSQVMLSVLDSVTYNNKLIHPDNAQLKGLESSIAFISENLYNYFQRIREIIANVETGQRKKSLYITGFGEFSSHIKPLNEIKMQILKHCNGNNTSLDISRTTGLKLSTVSTYLSQLKEKKLVDNGRKPKRLIDSFVIDLEVINKEGEK